MRFNIYYLGLLTLLTTTVSFGKIIYVDDDANGVNDGSSWDNAYTYLQDALADANDSDKPVEIRVAQGIYKPDQGTVIMHGICSSFELIKGVALFGGYAGIIEQDPNARNIELYESILSGDLDDNDDMRYEPNRDNEFSTPWDKNTIIVVTSSGNDDTAILEGFTISNGYNDRTYISLNNRHGAGMYNDASSPQVINCTFRYNRSNLAGGGMCNENNSNPIVTNCTFSNNSAELGGGMYNQGSNPILTNCKFLNNTGKLDSFNYWYDDSCDFGQGGGMYNTSSDPTLVNCTFINNSSLSSKYYPNYDSAGGGMYNINSNPNLINCSFRQNKAHHKGAGMYNKSSIVYLNSCEFINNSKAVSGIGIYLYGSDLHLYNCLFAGNRRPTMDYSDDDTEGGGIYVYESNFILENCTFNGNHAANGNAIFFFKTSYRDNIELKNSIFWDNENEISYSNVSNYANINISYNNIQGGQTSLYDPNGIINWGEGNIDTEPYFVNPGYWADADDPNIAVEPNDPNAIWIDGDYHLKSQAGRFDPNSQSWVVDDVNSPCIDLGDPMTPIGHELLPNGGKINMGAYGGTTEASKSLYDVNYFQQASYPIPADGAIDVALNAILSWISDVNAFAHEVYFGTSELPPFVQKQDNTGFYPSVLEPNTQYYWRIDDLDSMVNRVTGNVWTFLTTDNLPAYAYNPIPARDDIIDIKVNVILSWDVGLDAIAHDVYFGTDFNDVNDATLINSLGVLVSENQDANFYDPDYMEFDQEYFWRVDEIDSNGLTTKGDIWSFITENPPKGRACFTGLTPVWTDGTTVAISEAAAGQTISCLANNNKIEEIQEHQGTFDLYDITLDSGNCITVADEHYFMTDSGRWISSKNLTTQMNLKTAKGSIGIRCVTKRPLPYAGKVYNLKIQDSDKYMVGEDSVIVRDY